MHWCSMVPHITRILIQAFERQKHENLSVPQARACIRKARACIRKADFKAPHKASGCIRKAPKSVYPKSNVRVSEKQHACIRKAHFLHKNQWFSNKSLCIRKATCVYPKSRAQNPTALTGTYFPAFWLHKVCGPPKVLTTYLKCHPWILAVVETTKHVLATDNAWNHDFCCLLIWHPLRDQVPDHHRRPPRV